MRTDNLGEEAYKLSYVRALVKGLLQQDWLRCCVMFRY